jgi:outer membrane protein assembly factor BamB
MVAMPFGDYAIPVVKDGVVYNGSYALNAQDGTVLRRMAVDSRWCTSQAVVDTMLYAISENRVHAINTQTGEVNWLYQPQEEHGMISGPLVVADHLIYVGTSGPEYHPPRERFFALDAKSGAEVWRYPTGSYVAARVRDKTVYVSAGESYLYALDAVSGMLHWQYQFDAHGGYWPAVTENAVYMTTDGIYAFRSVTGALLWRQHPGNSFSGSFTPPVVLEEVVYLIRNSRRGQSALYALSANDGTEYWHTHIPTQYAPFSIAE